MHKQGHRIAHGTKKRKLIGTIEVAEKLRCHPATIPRLTKQKRLPPPHKILNKNSWWEDEIDDIVEAGFAGSTAEVEA